MGHQIPYRDDVPGAYKTMRSLEQFLAKGTLDTEILELVRLRVSQLNGCAYCVDLHSTRLEAEGVSARKIFAVGAWRESPFFTDRERAALDVAEVLTVEFNECDPQDRLADAYAAFTETELVELTTAAIAINGWNRLWVMFRTPEIEPLSSADDD